MGSSLPISGLVSHDNQRRGSSSSASRVYKSLGKSESVTFGAVRGTRVTGELHAGSSAWKVNSKSYKQQNCRRENMLTHAVVKVNDH